MRLRRDGVALAYVEAGSGAPPILLVHDLGSDHTCFTPQFEHFRRGHRVVAVDLRGHGQSGKPRQAYTIAVLADDLAWLSYELGLYRPVVLGHGLGAVVALDLAARYPDLPAAIVAVEPAPSSSVGAPTLTRHVVAPLSRSISSQDRAATTACDVPTLLIPLGARDPLGTRERASDSRREDRFPPSAQLGEDDLRDGEMTVSVEVNRLVDAFLTGRATRASPDQRLPT